LSPWAGRLKDPLWVKYDPRNLARIYVRDPGGRHWPIPYADLRQPPIALWELEAARKHLRESGKSDRTEPRIFAAIKEQRRLVKEAAKSSQQRRRRERTPQQSISPSPVNVTGKSTEPRDLKPFPVEIWDRE
jgi:putative transposase